MSNYYGVDPIDLSALKTISLAERGGKVKQADFARVHEAGSGVNGFLDSLPHILAGDTLRAVVGAIVAARVKQKPVIWGMGGHVVKCGLAPILIELMRRGFATGFAMNGSASIHDFEIALAGQTSEDVEAVLPDGRFGAAEETGREWNKATVVRSSRSELWRRRSPGPGARYILAPAEHAAHASLVTPGLARARAGDRSRRHRNRYTAHASRH